ncbi:hypothetical protein ACHAWF_009306 [Thalassiosira exigua]
MATASSSAPSPSVDDDIDRRVPVSIPPSSSAPLLGGHAAAPIARSRDVHGDENFPTGCAFSPDGTCVLTATASDGTFRLYDTPFGLLNGQGGGDDDENDEGGDGDDDDGEHDDDDGASTTRAQHDPGVEASVAGQSHNQNLRTPRRRRRQDVGPHPWKASLTSREGGDPPSSSSASYAWYPLMTSSDPLTSLYATCRGRSTPIHLIDAYTSKIRATYRPYNAVDEMEGPTVVEFSPDGRRVYGTGFRSDRTVAAFDVSVPGRDGMIARLGKTRRSADGQKGVPSAMAFPGAGGGPSNVFAVGTYSPASIYIYDDRMSNFHPAGTIVLYGGLAVVGHGRAFSRKKRRFGHVDGAGVDEDDDADLFSSARVNWFQSRARGGVTQLAWAPPASDNPYALFSASRRSDAVLSWDVRALSGRDARGGGGANHPVCGLRSYARDGDTNQRLEFELDRTGRRMYAGTGGSEGVVRVYDVKGGKLEGTLDVVGSDCEGDAVNGVSYFDGPGLGSYDALLAVAVGSRRFRDPGSDSDAEDGGKSDGELCPGFLQLHALEF